MKLHRLTLTNLNSLYGEHEIDLDASIGASPLFLICGPTGSGKTTILDGISLALFGQTPRLDGSRAADDLKVEHVMSRGTGVARSVLEFSLLDGYGERTRYRASWELARARQRPDGQFQKPTRELRRLDPDGSEELLTTGRKKSDHDEAFSTVLRGLTVADFERSVMLAQGRFDAFLSADDNDRTELLARLTDVERYRAIGQQAFLQARQAREAVQELRTRLDAIGGLSDDERAELADAAAALDAAIAEHDNRRATVVAQRTARQQLDETAAELEAVTVDLAELATRRAEAAPALARLEAWEHAAPALEQLRLLDAERVALERATTALAEVRDRLEAHTRSQEPLQRAVDAAKAALAAREQQAAAVAAQLPAAREAWQRFRVADGARQRLNGEHDAATTAVATCSSELESVVASEAQAVSVVSRLRGCLHELQHDELRVAWPSIDKAFERLTGTTRAAREAAARFDKANRASEQAARSHNDLTRAEDAARSAVDAAHREREAASAQLDAIAAQLRGLEPAPLDALGPEAARQLEQEGHLSADGDEAEARSLTTLRAATELVGRIERRRAALAALGAVADRLGELGIQAARQASAVADGLVVREQLAAAVHQRSEELEQRRSDLGAHERIVAGEQARLQLIDRVRPGEPCPLCLSTEHPVDANRDARCRMEQQLHDATRARDAASAAVDAATRALEAGRAALEDHTRSSAAVSREHAAAERAVRDQATQLAELISALPALPGEAPDDGALAGVDVAADPSQVATLAGSLAAAVRERAQALSARAGAIDALAADARSAYRAVRTFRATVTERGGALAECTKRTAAAAEALAAAQHALAEAGEQSTAAATRQAADADELDRALSSFGQAADALLELPESLTDALPSQVGAGDEQERRATEQRGRGANGEDARWVELDRLQRHARLAAVVARIATLDGALKAAEAEERRLQQEKVRLDATLTSAAQTLARVATSLDAAHVEHDAARAALAAHFDGREPDAVQAATEAATKEARDALQAAERELAVWANEHAALEASRAERASACDHHRAALIPLTQALHAAMAQLGLVSGVAAEPSADPPADRAAEPPVADVGSILPIEELRARDVAPVEREQLLRQRTELQREHDRLAERERLARQRHERLRADAARDGWSEHSEEQLAEQLAAYEQQLSELRTERGAIGERLAQASRADEQRAALAAALQEASAAATVAEDLNRLIGVGEGARFRKFAVALTLGSLLQRANVHLACLAPRYRLMQRLDDDGVTPKLDFDVADQEVADVRRPVSTLSGGERFLVSLALALGLSESSRSRLRIETLLLDEGFGTLDPQTLQGAISTLERLHHTLGAQVGLISHVEALRERIPAQIEVVRERQSRSRVRVRQDAAD